MIQNPHIPCDVTVNISNKINPVVTGNYNLMNPIGSIEDVIQNIDVVQAP